MDISFLDDFVVNPGYHDYLAILAGARNGFAYGVKVRLPHAIIMSLFYDRGDWRSRLRSIYRATKQHALNLAKFVALYKAILLLQRTANGGKERNTDTFIAGLIGGFVVFGERTAVNEQIVLYVVSRVVASFIPRADSPYSSSPRIGSAVKPIPPHPQYFAVFAALSWGAGMWVFRHRGETIQPGTFYSMKYLYRDSEVWSDLKTLLWHHP